jgi:hypothetical protein
VVLCVTPVHFDCPMVDLHCHTVVVRRAAVTLG